MPRKKGMKLDQALKLYIGLYCLCFLLTWLISIPMLVHVMPERECLLFVNPYFEYGSSAGKLLGNFLGIFLKTFFFSACFFVGLGPIGVAVATVTLIVLHLIQLRSLKSFLRQPGSHRSANYHGRPNHIFWRMVRNMFYYDFEGHGNVITNRR